MTATSCPTLYGKVVVARGKIIIGGLIFSDIQERHPVTQNRLPLSRFTVLDLTAHRAGPTAVRQLADWGADVIKIDIEGMEDRALFPFFENIAKAQYPKLIVMEDGINEQWERDILSWLLANGYHAAARTRGNVMLERNG